MDLWRYVHVFNFIHSSAEREVQRYDFLDEVCLFIYLSRMLTCSPIEQPHGRLICENSLHAGKSGSDLNVGLFRCPLGKISPD